MNIKLGWNSNVENITTCKVTTWCRHILRHYHIHTELQDATIWTWPRLKGRKGQTKVNIKLVLDFDVENISVKLWNDTGNSCRVIVFRRQLDLELVWKLHLFVDLMVKLISHSCNGCMNYLKLKWLDLCVPSCFKRHFINTFSEVSLHFLRVEIFWSIYKMHGICCRCIMVILQQVWNSFAQRLPYHKIKKMIQSSLDSDSR